MPNQNENEISFAATRDEGATHPEINLRIIDRSVFDKTKRILDQTSPETQRPRHAERPQDRRLDNDTGPPSRGTRSPPRIPQNRELLIRPLDTCAADAAAQMSTGRFQRNNDALDAAKSHDDL